MNFSKYTFVLTLTLIISILISPLSLSFASEYAINPSDLVAESAILINQNTGQVIFDKNANEPMFPASTTKILTAIIILEDLPLDEVVTIDANSPYVSGSAIALVPNEQLSVEQLVTALIISSANDVAEALAIHHSGSIEAFAQVMNTRAAEMGAINSNFENPHGLPNPNHLTTAYDLALIAKHAMMNETFRKIVKTTRYEIPPTNMKAETRYLNSTNSFYQGIEGCNDLITVRGKKVPIAYEYVTGIKRGFTEQAMSCLVSAATIENKSYISVVLKSNGIFMYQDSRLLLDLGLFGMVSKSLYKKDEVIENLALNNAKKTSIPLVTENELTIDVPDTLDIATLTKKIDTLPNIDLPIKKGEKLGTISYFNGESLLLIAPLVAQDDFAGGDLLSKETHLFSTNERPLFSVKWFIFIFTRLFIAILIWRTIVTVVRVRKIKKKRKTLDKLNKLKTKQSKSTEANQPNTARLMNTKK